MVVYAGGPGFSLFVCLRLLSHREFIFYIFFILSFNLEKGSKGCKCV